MSKKKNIQLELAKKAIAKQRHKEEVQSHSRIVGQVMETNQYGLFKFVVGNREVKANKKLEQSIKEHGIIQPIKVDSNYNIIEGQHRFTFAKKYSKPIRYIITEDQGVYNLEEISELNRTFRSWTAKDYIHSFAERGNIEYRRLQKLIADSKDINAPIFTLASIASGYRSKGKKSDIDMFSNGLFKFYNYEGLLVFLSDYRKFLARTGIKAGRDLLAAFFYLYTLENFELERLINKVNSTGKAERLEGVQQPNVIIENLVDAYNNRLSTDSPSFIAYEFSTEPKTKGEVILTGKVSNTLVKMTD